MGLYIDILLIFLGGIFTGFVLKEMRDMTNYNKLINDYLPPHELAKLLHESTLRTCTGCPVFDKCKDSANGYPIDCMSVEGWEKWLLQKRDIDDGI